MHAHAHSHAPGGGHHHHGPGAHSHGASTRGLKAALALTSLFLVAEVVGGIVSNSLALLADAGHMLTDVGALALSLFVAWFSRQSGDSRKTFGYLRWEILAALINGTTLLLISAWILWEGVARLRAPEAVASGVMIVIAVGGLAVNALSAWLLHGDAQASLNHRGAYLHVLGDLLGSVGTVAAAFIVRYTGWLAADPVASIVVTLIIVRGAWRLVRESVDVLLESTPAHIALSDIRAQLGVIPGIESVHDLHVWSVGSGLVAMSVHVVVREPERHQHVLEHVHDAMRLFGIGHVTVQLERREMFERELHLHP